MYNPPILRIQELYPELQRPRNQPCPHYKFIARESKYDARPTTQAAPGPAAQHLAHPARRHPYRDRVDELGSVCNACDVRRWSTE